MASYINAYDFLSIAHSYDSISFVYFLLLQSITVLHLKLPRIYRKSKVFLAKLLSPRTSEMHCCHHFLSFFWSVTDYYTLLIVTVSQSVIMTLRTIYILLFRIVTDYIVYIRYVTTMYTMYGYVWYYRSYLAGCHVDIHHSIMRDFIPLSTCHHTLPNWLQFQA